ncbi:hypothetical protein FGRMN_10488 [Fusarium graminum]|nr:hypothetical protein FGRMN_10488 [Fusarium graminum]
MNGQAIAALQIKGTNVSVAYPYDSNNIAVARFNQDSEDKWSLGSFPTPFGSPTPTNKTDPSDMRLDSLDDNSMTLSSFDSAAVNLGIANGARDQLSILYIGKDAQLHSVVNADGAWKEEKGAGVKKWPRADNASGRLAVVSALDSDEIWVYYASGDKILQLHNDGTSWKNAKTPSSDTTSDNSDADDGADDGGSKSGDAADGEETSTGGNSSPGAKEGGGMTTGAKAGIGIGVCVSVLAFAAAGFFYFRRRQQRRAPDQRKSSAELDSGGSYHPVELATPTHGPQELSATHERKYELLGDTGHRHGAS